jgi:uncharacterized protein YpmB
MLNWIKFIAVFLLSLAAIILVTVFYSANKPIASAKSQAIEEAIGTGQIMNAEYAQLYNGNASSVTVFGVDGTGVETAVFVDGKTEGNFKEVKLADGITAEKAVENVKQELDVKKILHVKLGMEEDAPVWEVTFKNENGKLNYVYVFFESGQWWKRILNL